MEMSNTINLGKEVIVSDPSYEIPTWCQKIVKGVLAGEYQTFCKKYDTGDWGNRVSMLMVVHNDHKYGKLKWKPEGPRGHIGVDSGQAGIFDISTYRNDDIEIPQGDGDISFFGENYFKEEGGKWYTKICSFTLAEKQWGNYTNGVVCRSGFGDGGYDLFVARVNRKVVAFAIDFGVEENKYIDFNWYVSEVHQPETDNLQ
jgi:hypothetical protein